jgi:hypothetical protein
LTAKGTLSLSFARGIVTFWPRRREEQQHRRRLPRISHRESPDVFRITPNRAAIDHQPASAGYRAKLIGQHLIAGVVGELDDQIAICRKRLVELAEELKSASGERRNFLLQVRHQWEGKLKIVRLNAPKDRQNEINNLQAELKAWTIPLED